MFSIQDGKGKTSTTEINLPAATTLANAEVMAREVAKLINPIIAGAIVRIGLVRHVSLPTGLRATAGANSDVEEGAPFQYRPANGLFSGLRLPTFDEANILAGTRTVNLTGAVATFNTAMLSGVNLEPAGGTGTVQPCDKRGEDLVALEFAREQFLSSRG